MRQNFLKRSFDFTSATILLVLLALPIALIAVLVKLTSPGPVLYWSNRVGRDNRVFQMPKFRTMQVQAPQLATHLLTDADTWITPLGKILRQLSLDELPQLISIIRGDMSFVGPRPALFNQDDLIKLRTEVGVHQLTPGLTGWAQVNGRDELAIPMKVAFDRYYLEHCRSFLFDLQIIALTIVRVAQRDGIRQAEPALGQATIELQADASSRRKAA